MKKLLLNDIALEIFSLRRKSIYRFSKKKIINSLIVSFYHLLVTTPSMTLDSSNSFNRPSPFAM